MTTPPVRLDPADVPLAVRAAAAEGVTLEEFVAEALDLFLLGLIGPDAKREVPA